MAAKFLKLFGFGKKENPFIRLSRDLLEFSHAFSSITDMSTLMPSVIGKIRDLVGASEAALFLLDHGEGRYRLVHSRGIDLKPHLRIRGDYYFEFNDRLVRWLLNNRLPLVVSRMHEVISFLGEEERDILRFVAAELCIPLEAHNRFIGVLCLGRKRGEGDYQNEDLQLLVAITAQAALAFENNRLQSEAIERERMRRELEIAGELQRRLNPAVAPTDYKGYEITGFCIPCTEVAGDYYDYLPIDERQLGLVIGDVTGHGMRSGILMGMAKSCLATVVGIDPSCGTVMRTLNSLICGLGERRTIMTCFYSVLDAAGGRLTYANAGHSFPYLYRSRKDTLVDLGLPAYPLGVRRDYPYAVDSVKLEPGDFVLYYSDGFVESLNQKEEQFGFERLEASILKHRCETAAGLSEGVKEDLFDFMAGEPHQDDLTIMVLKVLEK